MQFRPPDRFTGWLDRWNQLCRQFRRQLGERYALAGLSETRALVLQALFRSSEHSTQSELASDLGLSESNLCSLIERMRGEGLLERERSPLDRRKTVLTLTPAGCELCGTITRIHVEFERELLESLPGHLRGSLASTVTALFESLNGVESGSTVESRAA